MSDINGAPDAPVTPEPDELDVRLDKMVEEGDGGTPTPIKEAGDEPKAPEGGEPTSGAVGATSEADKAGQPQPGANGLDPTAPTQALTQQGRLGSDDKGNLIDQQGNIVASAGKERRLWERVQRYEHYEVPQLRQQLNDMTHKHAQVEVLNKVPQQLGLNNEEALQGLRLIASYKKDPNATIQYILTEARTAGHNVNAENQGQMDLAAVSRMLDQRLGPMLQDRADQQRTSEADAEATRQYQDFTTRFPDAVLHEDVIAGVLKRNPTMSPDAAYYQLRLWAQEHGLNWNQPLQAQVQAAQQGGNTQQPIPPLGGGRGGNAPVTDTARAASVAGADADTGDIVKEAMREAGMNPD